MRYLSPLAQNAPYPRRVAVMGSTGSIGRNTLAVLEGARNLFCVTALAGGGNLKLLAEQATRWRPRYLAVKDREGVDLLKGLLTANCGAGYRPEILHGPEGYATLAALGAPGLSAGSLAPAALGPHGVDVVISAQSGSAGLAATLAAALAGKTICLANKESLVMAGGLLGRVCQRTGAALLPVDSEHGAIFQCLGQCLGQRLNPRGSGHSGDPGVRPEVAEAGLADVARLILTASGGPFLGKKRGDLAHITPGEALQHPNWNMGSKITIDSATLMNKGLEVIEACRLYGARPDEVAVAVHPQSVVHSLVEWKDGSLTAQLARPDMRLPIAAALYWPHMARAAATGVPLLDLAKAGTLTFLPPDDETFPGIALAREALRRGRTVEYNAADEVAVARFLAGDIGFLDIFALVRFILDNPLLGDSVLPGPDSLLDCLDPAGTPHTADMAGEAGCPEFPDDSALSDEEFRALAAAELAIIEERDALARTLAEAWEA